MTDSAAEFLSAHVVHAEEGYRWGELRLHVTSLLCRDLPPRELIASARPVVLGAGGVLVVRDPTGVHILPGGRRQAGETLEQTVRREVGGYELGAELQPTAMVQRLPCSRASGSS